MNKKKFILTQDQKTYEQLIKSGFTWICQDGNTHIFMNNGTINFTESEVAMVYSNKMFL